MAMDAANTASWHRQAASYAHRDLRRQRVIAETPHNGRIRMGPAAVPNAISARFRNYRTSAQPRLQSIF